MIIKNGIILDNLDHYPQSNDDLIQYVKTLIHPPSTREYNLVQPDQKYYGEENIDQINTLIFNGKVSPCH